MERLRSSLFFDKTYLYVETRRILGNHYDDEVDLYVFTKGNPSKGFFVSTWKISSKSTPTRFRHICLMFAITDV
jgi:hypothetical protein